MNNPEDTTGKDAKSESSSPIPKPKREDTLKLVEVDNEKQIEIWKTLGKDSSSKDEQMGNNFQGAATALQEIEQGNQDKLKPEFKPRPYQGVIDKTNEEIVKQQKNIDVKRAVSQDIEADLLVNQSETNGLIKQQNDNKKEQDTLTASNKELQTKLTDQKEPPKEEDKLKMQQQFDEQTKKLEELSKQGLGIQKLLGEKGDEKKSLMEEFKKSQEDEKGLQKQLGKLLEFKDATLTKQKDAEKKQSEKQQSKQEETQNLGGETPNPPETPQKDSKSVDQKDSQQDEKQGQIRLAGMDPSKLTKPTPEQKQEAKDTAEKNDPKPLTRAQKFEVAQNLIGGGLNMIFGNPMEGMQQIISAIDMIKGSMAKKEKDTGFESQPSMSTVKDNKKIFKDLMGCIEGAAKKDGKDAKIEKKGDMQISEDGKTFSQSITVNGKELLAQIQGEGKNKHVSLSSKDKDEDTIKLMSGIAEKAMKKGGSLGSGFAFDGEKLLGKISKDGQIPKQKTPDDPGQQQQQQLGQSTAPTYRHS